MRRARSRLALALAWAALALGGCSDDPRPAATPAGAGAGGGDAARGRQVYLAQCTACHANDPGQDGPLGPAVKGASKDLLEARLVRGTYPPGYTPKRPTSVMQPLPHLAADVPDLTAYLK